MKQKFKLFQRRGYFYREDCATGKRISLKTQDRDEAARLLNAFNESNALGAFAGQIARVYLSTADPAALTRTWQFAMDEAAKGKHGPNKVRWQTGMAQKTFDHIRHLNLVETRSEHLWQVLDKGTVSTKVYLRRLHNFALDMNWLLAPIIPRRLWPQIKFAEKRAITAEEHQKILAGEKNAETHAFYELLWHLGGSQTDVATLRAEYINWDRKILAYGRLKTGSSALIRLGKTETALLRSLPHTGYLFPWLAKCSESDRASAFSRRCFRVGVEGVTLHSYRYAWAERARAASYPLRSAQEALGHKSAAVHRAYAKQAEVIIPSLGEYEERQAKGKIISVEFEANDAALPPGVLPEDQNTSTHTQSRA